MNLELSKAINKEAVKRIYLLSKKIKILENLQDGIYLREALLQKNPVWKVKTNYIESIINQNIGPISTSKECNLERSQNNHLAFRQNRPNLEKVEFEISLARSNNYPFNTRVLASIENKTLHTKDLNLDPLSGGNFGNIYALATYFYNKYEAYRKIHDLLVEKKELILSQISAEYVEALIELFSVEKTAKNLENYSIPKEFIREETRFINIPSLEAKAIFSVSYTHSVKGAFYQDLILCLSINKSENLVYDIFPVYNAEINVEDEKIYDFINKNTNLWLKNLEQMADFGMDIYNLLKTKIFLSNT
jgi:hypothetical protein